MQYGISTVNQRTQYATNTEHQDGELTINAVIDVMIDMRNYFADLRHASNASITACLILLSE